MKQLVHLIALPARIKPTQAQLQFLEDLSLKFVFEGAILIKFLEDLFLWYMPKKIEYLDPDYITKMIENDQTLSEIYQQLSQRTKITNFMQVANHLDDDNLLRLGDVYASNVKLNSSVASFTIQTDSAQDPQQIGYLYQNDLAKIYSISIYTYEYVETT